VNYFGVVPDIVTTVKGLTNGAIPMGAVFASRKVYDALMQGPESQIELFQGYTYSSHPAACAAGLAIISIYREENLLPRAAEIEAYRHDAIHSLKGLLNVINIRTIGLIAGIELESRAGPEGSRASDAFVDCFERGLLIRVTGDIIALSPP
jgi:beta-alanine--pyruvate transaminase